MNKSLLIILCILTAGCVIIFVGYRILNKPFKDPLNGDAIRVSANKLFSDFSSNESIAQKKYVPEKVGDKKVEVTGEVKEVGKNDDDETYYILKTADELFGVKCIMDKSEQTADAKPGDLITLRGFCDGLNMDVIVNRCRLLK